MVLFSGVHQMIFCKLTLNLFLPVDESYHVLYRNGELNLSKLLKTELGAGPGSNGEATAATVSVSYLSFRCDRYCDITCLFNK